MHASVSRELGKWHALIKLWYSSNLYLVFPPILFCGYQTLLIIGVHMVQEREEVNKSKKEQRERKIAEKDRYFWGLTYPYKTRKSTDNVI